MTRVSAAISRRLMLGGLVAAPLAPRLAMAAGQSALPIAPDADVVLIAMADIHSSYERLPALIATVKRLKADADGKPVAILINGDMFERGNAVARNSEGLVDWGALGALSAVAPTVLNIGNHEIALRDDLATVVAGAERIGITVIGNVTDKRSGKLFAPRFTQLRLAGRVLGVVGLAPNDPEVWRAAGREILGLEDPLEGYAAAAPEAFAGAHAGVVLSHAGLSADKALLEAVPPGMVIIGGHDHLDFTHLSGGGALTHPGCWGEAVEVISLNFRDGRAIPSLRRVPVDPVIGEDQAIRGLVQAAGLVYKPAEMNERIATGLPRMDRRSSILFAADAVRRAAEADIALLNHSAFGAPFYEGQVTRYDLENFVRFDGQAMRAEVSGETLARILARANQDEATAFDARTGDYVHSERIRPDPTARYVIATSDWVAGRQQSYLGETDLAFAPAEGVTIKDAIEQALRAEG